MKPKFHFSYQSCVFFALVFLCWLCFLKKSCGCSSHIMCVSCIGIIVHVGAISLSHWCCPSHVGVDSSALVCPSCVAIVSLVLVLFLSCWCSSWCYFLCVCATLPALALLFFLHRFCYSSHMLLLFFVRCYCHFSLANVVVVLMLVLQFFSN